MGHHNDLDSTAWRLAAPAKLLLVWPFAVPRINWWIIHRFLMTQSLCGLLARDIRG